jgi:SAM-dependent methyltransferase
MTETSARTESGGGGAGAALPASTSLSSPPAPSAEQCSALRTLVADAGFTAPAVCNRVGIASIYDFISLREGRCGAVPIADALDVLIRLFMDVELVDGELVRRHLGVAGAGLLEDVGLLRTHTGDPARVHAGFLLYPTEGLWIASDLNVSPDGPAHTVLTEDAVYPAITKNTRHFLASLPSTPCEDFLELCGGTGIAALLAARYAARTWSVDITERATRFARFNAALNGVPNITAARGDLYDAVPGRTFDRIVAHPPYMPALEQKYIFRDGGEDGEQITRRIVAGLPERLRPGGRLYCTCMLTDRREANAEHRIRAMLGDRAAEFDVLLVTERLFPPTDYYFRLALTGRAELGEVVRRHEVFQRLEVERLVYGSFVIQRPAACRPTFTARRQAGPNTTTADVEWLLGWEAESAARAGQQPDDLRPVVSPACRMRLGHVFDAGGWTVEDCQLTTSAPFALEARCPPWTAVLLERCDGKTGVEALHGELRRSGVLPAALGLGEFSRLVRSLVSGGFLRLPGILDTS